MLQASSSTITLAFVILLFLSCQAFAFPTIFGGGATRLSLFSRQVDATTAAESTSPSVFLKKQFQNPAEVIAVLLLIGGDIVQKAIAQLSSGVHAPVLVTPAIFSFGWVGYAFGALMSAFGDGMLMPSPDIPSIVINVGSRIVKNNESFVLGRLLRDLEIEYGEHTNPPKLVIRKFETVPGCAKPSHDELWWSFVPFLIAQIGIAAIPLRHKEARNWSILMVTGAGTLLAMATASLPQWREEKFDCGTDAKDTFILTRGNGHNNIFVIEPGKMRSAEGGKTQYVEALNLEHLAVNRALGRPWTRVLTVFLAVLWIGLLITVAGMDQDTWSLLAVGALGMIHNVLVAGLVRKPKAHGIPLSPNFNEIGRQNQERRSIMDALKAVENTAPGIGLALVDVLFPGPRVLREDERVYWDNVQRLAEQSKREARLPRRREVGIQTEGYRLGVPIIERKREEIRSKSL